MLLFTLSLATKVLREEAYNNFTEDPINIKLVEIKQRFDQLANVRRTVKEQERDDIQTKSDMQQAVKDLKQLYGEESDSDEGRYDDDSEGIAELEATSRTFKQSDELDEKERKACEKFKMNIPKR